MSSVNFTLEAAKRIARAVHKIEKLPYTPDTRKITRRPVGRKVGLDPFETVVSSDDGVTWKAFMQGGRIFYADQAPFSCELGMDPYDKATWMTLTTQNQLIYLEYVPSTTTATLKAYLYTAEQSAGAGPAYYSEPSGVPTWCIPLKRVLFSAYTGVGANGTAPSTVDRLQFGDITIASNDVGPANLTIPFPFHIGLWDDDEGTEPGTSYWSVDHGLITDTVAGEIYFPDGVSLNVSVVAPTLIEAPISIWLSLEIDDGACTATITDSPPTADFYAKPAILNYLIGQIIDAGTVYASAQALNSNIFLPLVPAFFPDYDPANSQILVCDPGTGYHWKNITETAHPFKLYISNHVDEDYPELWFTTLGETSAGDSTAGRVVLPDCTELVVDSPLWQQMTGDTYFYLRLEFTQGVCTGTIVNTAPTDDLTSDPAIVSYLLAKAVDNDPDPPTIVQYQSSVIGLQGSVIPAFYVDFDNTKVQHLVHRAGIFTWATAGDCTDTDIVP